MVSHWFNRSLYALYGCTIDASLIRDNHLISAQKVMANLESRLSANRLFIVSLVKLAKSSVFSATNFNITSERLDNFFIRIAIKFSSTINCRDNLSAIALSVRHQIWWVYPFWHQLISSPVTIIYRLHFKSTEIKRGNNIRGFAVNQLVDRSMINQTTRPADSNIHSRPFGRYQLRLH